MELLIPSDVPCPVVHLEWDRSHEDFDAIVRARTDTAIVVSPIHDLWPVAGCQWIRGEELVSCDLLPDDAPATRVLNQLGVRMFAVDEDALDLHKLLRNPAFATAPIGIYRKQTGSAEIEVGVVTDVSDFSCDLRTISTDADWDDEVVVLFDDIVALEWGTDYLRALAMLLYEA